MPLVTWAVQFVSSDWSAAGAHHRKILSFVYLAPVSYFVLAFSGPHPLLFLLPLFFHQENPAFLYLGNCKCWSSWVTSQAIIGRPTVPMASVLTHHTPWILRYTCFGQWPNLVPCSHTQRWGLPDRFRSGREDKNLFFKNRELRGSLRALRAGYGQAHVCILPGSLWGVRSAVLGLTPPGSWEPMLTFSGILQASC